MFKNGNIKTKEIISNDQQIDTINAFYKKIIEVTIKVISDNSPIIDDIHLINTAIPTYDK